MSPAKVTGRTRQSSAAAVGELHEIALHGHRVYRSAGEGPVLVLVHGITSTSDTWSNVVPYLAERFAVIALDLLGHGESAKPRGDYSLGAYACGIRDLLFVLGHERATFVGHSLGGGIAMQLAYQFPEHCERLVLVSSGGLGRDITALLRATGLAGSELVLPLLVNERVVGAGRVVGRLLGRVGLRVHTDLGEVLRDHASLSDGDARAAFVHTLRTIVDSRGQRVDARDRLYLAQSIPFLIIWAEHDPIIPVEHTLAAHALVPGRVGSSCFRTPAISRTSTIRCASSACSPSSWRRPSPRGSMRAAGGSCCAARPPRPARRRGVLGDERRAERRR